MTVDSDLFLPLKDDACVAASTRAGVNVSGLARFAPAEDGVMGLRLADGESLSLAGHRGSGAEFTWSVWVHLPSAPLDELGSVLSCFDHNTRTGAELSFTDAHSTSSRVNASGLQLGVDWGAAPQWESLGRPLHSVGILALAVHRGELFAGTLGDDGLGRVYVWRDEWEELPGATTSNCVSALASHNGALYAGTTRYRTGGSAMNLPPNDEPGGEIRQWDGEWKSIGRLPGVDGVASLVVHGGQLYAAAMYQEGIWRWSHDAWESCGSPGRRVLTLGVHEGRVHAGGNDHADADKAIELTRQGVIVGQREHDGGGGVFAFGADGAWEGLGYQADTTQVYSLTTSRGTLLASTWPNGLVYERRADGTWVSTGRLGRETEVMGLITYNASLYGGTLPHAQLHRRDPGGWTHVGTVDVTPNVLYRRAAGLAVHRGALNVGTLPSGAVHRMSVGDVATYDESLGSGWHHVVVTCDAEYLTLWTDGERTRVRRHVDAPIEVIPDLPLRVGSGSRKSFAGTIRNLRIWEHAVRPHEVLALMQTDDPRLAVDL